MKIDTNTLPNDPEQLKIMLLELQADMEKRLSDKDKIITEQALKINQFIERYELAKRKQFGKSSEQLPGAGETFNEAEEIIDAKDKALLAESDNHQVAAKKRKPVRKPLPKELPRKVVIIDLPAVEQVCKCCRGNLHKIGETRSEKLEFVPAYMKVIETVRPKYACHQCEKIGTSNSIHIAPMPTAPIPKGIATASLLSQIISAKYQYALPLYRQERMFNEYGIELSRQTMSDWVMVASELFKPLVEEIKSVLLSQAVIHADETPLKVINAENNSSYMWVYCSGDDSSSTNAIPSIVLYDYHNSRAAPCVVDYLDGYQGYLQVDGYAAYGKTDAKLAGCMAHARRKFTDAKAVQGKNKTGKADVVLNLIGKLYGIEASLKGKSVSEKYLLRQKESASIFKSLNEWVVDNKERITPKSKLGEAITYWHNQKHKLVTYLADGRINIDNNRAERAVKPFVIGRKNWLFSNTTNGARASAILYSIIETAKANGLLVDNYLQTCLDELANKPDNLTHLLPWNFKQG